MSSDLVEQFQSRAEEVRVLRKKSSAEIYPPQELIFEAFRLCPIEKLKVVVIGQDPYHSPSMAHGLAFSVPAEQKRLPPSLLNIFKELSADLGLGTSCTFSGNGSGSNMGDLTPWARQGVLLVNTVLTVERGKPASHSGLGWQELVVRALQELARLKPHMVWMVWGKSAESALNQLDLPDGHLVLRGAHPSPFSAHRGFFGTRHFSQANAYLKAHGLEPIQWDCVL